MKQYTREIAIGITNILLLLLLATTTHGFFTADNIADLFLANMPVMLMALGMTAIIVTAQIDISVGSIFALCSIVAGLTARAGAPSLAFLLIAIAVGAACGALNGALTAYLKIPSIVVTLATMVALRDGLRWGTQGAWVGDLPASFLRFGIGQRAYTLVVLLLTVLLTLAFAWGLQHLRAGRAVFATGSNEAAATQLGINTRLVVFAVFTLTGALTGLAATLNAVRFNQVPSNSGLGLEMKVIAAVAVGGAAITGGAATITGTVLGVILLGTIGPALTFLGVSAYWEKALQGAIILLAVSANALSAYRRRSTAVEATVAA
ncbi:monosaccharide ABC transporter membrane protein, CUT2 family [Terriglobus roseus DSM 18391]|uniref:Monosaccharide ABC transporter membrane protein, CUT2 family n=1 Tax=Terriglobus roseus (strain DSM 18391 / NRRL B-41598 / KBS 63) TaxID=926566 RepID=I3ZBV9_TERRK|nr:ABC transporter permease [Terriglobus roseus]AFL86727.1 monosaccharide ABC transporter membrane protein, CUT2 family [Terriglobus roseus DSM 18391]